MPILSSFLARLYVVQLWRKASTKPTNKDKKPPTLRSIPTSSKIHAPFALGSPKYTTRKITATITRINPIFSQSPSAITKVKNKDLNFFLSSHAERGNPTPTPNARLPQKTPAASLGQARNLTITKQIYHTASTLSRLYAGYEMGYYCVRIKGDIELAALLPLQAKGYQRECRKRHYQLFRAVLSYTEGSLALRCLS